MAGPQALFTSRLLRKKATSSLSDLCIVLLVFVQAKKLLKTPGLFPEPKVAGKLLPQSPLGAA